jgi:hypothetical protein
MKKPKFLGYSPKTRKFLQSIFSEYEISDAAGLQLLTVAGACMDRMQEAEDLLKKEGLTVPDRCGGSKLHPANIILKDSRAHFLAALKALNLDLEPLKTVGRPGVGGR